MLHRAVLTAVVALPAACLVGRKLMLVELYKENFESVLAFCKTTTVKQQLAVQQMSQKLAGSKWPPGSGWPRYELSDSGFQNGKWADRMAWPPLRCITAARIQHSVRQIVYREAAGFWLRSQPVQARLVNLASAAHRSSSETSHNCYEHTFLSANELFQAVNSPAYLFAALSRLFFWTSTARLFSADR